MKFGMIASVLVMYEPWKWLELDLKGVEKMNGYKGVSKWKITNSKAELIIAL